jgi:RimJ/RimL family protein N-acetyltransferase
VRIETPRLVVRLFAAFDIAAYAAIVADARVTKYLADGTPHCFEEAKSYVEDSIRRDRQTGIARYAVVRKDSGDLIGFCGFKELDDYIDFGWRYSRHAWGQRYATEAALAVLGYGLTALRLRCLSAGSFVENIGSVRIIERLGFPFVQHAELQGKPIVRYFQSRVA